MIFRDRCVILELEINSAVEELSTLECFALYVLPGPVHSHVICLYLVLKNR